jgi:hypothetical protein
MCGNTERVVVAGIPVDYIYLGSELKVVTTNGSDYFLSLICGYIHAVIMFYPLIIRF